MQRLIFAVAASLCCALAQAAPPAPDLDLDIVYYNKVVTPEGVTRESRYTENMLRRPGHVWVSRVLPASASMHDEHEHDSVKRKVSLNATPAAHKHFNPVVLPRHVTLERDSVRVAYVDSHSKDVIAIAKTEFENVNFDGSWANSFYLLDPALVMQMPLSKRASSTAGARWREREQNGIFQRVLWDEQRQIPLIVESGDVAATFYRRIDVTPRAQLQSKLPWAQLTGYHQKEYADFLD